MTDDDGGDLLVVSVTGSVVYYLLCIICCLFVFRQKNGLLSLEAVDVQKQSHNPKCVRFTFNSMCRVMRKTR